MVQGVIGRMAGNSVRMKTSAAIPVTAIIVLSGLSNEPHWLPFLSGCVPVVAFWAMDARYLHLERCHAKLHEAIVAGALLTPFDLDYRPYASTVDSAWRVAWSWSVCMFYGPLLAVIAALLVFLTS